MLRTFSALLVCALLVTGCGTDKPPARTASAAPTTSTPSSTPSSTSPTPSSSPFPRAANGSNLRACADGRCEVLVTHPVRVPLSCSCGVSLLSVAHIGSDGVDFHVITSGGSVADALEQTPDQGGPSTINKLSIEVIAIKGRRAVIKLSRK